MYIHELRDWPNFKWDKESAIGWLIQLRHQQGRFIGGMESIGFHLSEETFLQTLTQDVVKSSEIEGEILDPSLVRSSVARHLGMERAATDIIDKNIDGIVEMVLDATQNFNQPFTKDRLLSWHLSLFPTGRNGYTKIRTGEWRAGPVQVVSGQIGNETVHFEGPPADRVGHEMELFLEWLNNEKAMDFVLKAAIAHLWFVTVHPFDDGYGRIGRAIADMLLGRSEKSSNRFYSLSSQIQKERKSYYEILEKTQNGSLDVTSWIHWFFSCLGRAIEEASSPPSKVAYKAKFWEALVDAPLNDRQRKVINRIIDGFEGKLTSSKWAKIAKCSQDTALRDIIDLVERGILTKNPEGGPSTSYSLFTVKK